MTDLNLKDKGQKAILPNPVLSAGYTYKFVGNFEDAKRNKFTKEVKLKYPIFGMAYIALINTIIEEDIGYFSLTSIDYHQNNGEIKTKAGIEYMYEDICKLFK